MCAERKEGGNIRCQVSVPVTPPALSIRFSGSSLSLHQSGAIVDRQLIRLSAAAATRLVLYTTSMLELP